MENKHNSLLMVYACAIGEEKLSSEWHFVKTSTVEG